MIIMHCTFSACTRSQTRSGSKRAIRTMRLPTKLWPITAHCVAPCMSGAIGR